MGGIRKTPFHFILGVAILFLLQPSAWSCVDSPGPNTADPAPVGEKHKVKFEDPNNEKVQMQLLEGPLKKIAEKCGTDLFAVSGYRSCTTNKGVAKSQHLLGKATDLSFCKGKSLGDMFKILAEAGCGGIGCYPTFIQCDIGPKRQWGPCPGKRPPADDPKDEKADAQKPDSAYDSKTPPEPSSSSAGGGGGSPSGSSGPSALPSGQASYPTSNMPIAMSNGTIPDQRNDAVAPKKPEKLEQGQVPESSSAITKSGDQSFPVNTIGFSSPVNALIVGQQSSASSPKNGVAAVGRAGSVSGAGLLASDSAAGFGNSNAETSARSEAPASANGSRNGGGQSSFNAEALKEFGKGLGTSPATVEGSDTDAYIKKVQEQEFLGASSRELASSNVSDGIGERNGLSLFERSHVAHESCLRRSCVSGRKK